MSRSQLPSLSRRDWLQLSAVGALGLPVSGWFDRLAANAAEQATPRPAHKNCILLFMNGGPSHIDTFDPKPENESSEFKPIDTSVSGIQISENLPKVAQVMQHCALLRGMSTSEGSHGRARYYMHTGYRLGVGGVVHPAVGAIASARLGRPDDPLPNYVSIGNDSFGAGYAGPLHAPLIVSDPSKGVENLHPNDDLKSFDRRVGLLQEIEAGFLSRIPEGGAEAHLKTYQRAAALMHSAKARAFDLSQELDQTRDRYGRNKFGQGCLLARRLVENGVSFVEVGLTGWDTHMDNTGKVKNLSATLDPAMAALISDLQSSGLLDSTLVVWMGDFGRTPHLGKRGGRDHYPKAWTTVLAGAGMKTGQVIGRTDKQGAIVEDRPTSAIDFMATVCKALDIDYTENFIARGNRPVRTVDKGEKLVTELF